ncbi:MAG TPA: DNA mismatch repair protein MutS, partial [Rhodospirillum rubrum]|nr:DNA mismatch repair protein MutS [Rhodospirillum rubrum]
PSPSRPPPVPPAGPAGARMRPPALGDLRSGHLVDMDGRTAGRLKRGRLDIDGRIDLHGMTQESAHAALRGFLRRGREQGWRCVLVITGKGGRSGDSGTGVLRRAVPMWLNGVDLRPLVVGFINATPRHGGEGALYVMLRRRRESGP